MFDGWDTITIGGTTYNGHFDNEYQDLHLGVPVGNSAPAFLGRYADLSALTPGTAVTVTSELYAVSGAAYPVASVRPHPQDGGPGTMRVILKKTG